METKKIAKTVWRNFKYVRHLEYYLGMFIGHVLGIEFHVIKLYETVHRIKQKIVAISVRHSHFGHYQLGVYQ